MHLELLKKYEKAKGISENSPYNCVTRKAKNKIGIISSSSAYNYAVEAADLLGFKASILKLGMTHPLPEKQIAKFLKANRKIIVVEELEPYLEMQIKAIAKDHTPNVEIYGKMTKQYFNRRGELSTRDVATGFSQITGKRLPFSFQKIDKAYSEVASNLPARPPILCAGCPHRASFYLTRKVGGDKTLYATDIGCYALGIGAPLNVGDMLICMGSSIGTAQGMSRTTGQNTMALVGDSTFFHATIPGLINAVYNNARVTLVILDNSTTAMTGHQPHPGTGKTGMGSPEICKACGVKYVKAVNPHATKEATAVLREALLQPGPSAVILRAPCTLVEAREKRLKDIQIRPYKISDKCTNCMTCIKLLGCPALILEKGKVKINETLCAGCGLCVTVCPYKVIEVGDRNQ
jgi:indolepyruvate ferredoxin oxidoreductase alpha subunit